LYHGTGNHSTKSENDGECEYLSLDVLILQMKAALIQTRSEESPKRRFAVTAMVVPRDEVETAKRSFDLYRFAIIRLEDLREVHFEVLFFILFFFDRKKVSFNWFSILKIKK